MKKVLSVALASAMVLGMGASAFATEYNTTSSGKADWIKDLQFKDDLIVIDKDGNLVIDSTTKLGTKNTADFRPGDEIWMPMSASNQKVYNVEGNQSSFAAHTAKKYIVKAGNSTSVPADTIGVARLGTGLTVADASIDPFYLNDLGTTFDYGYNTLDQLVRFKAGNVFLCDVNGAPLKSTDVIFKETTAAVATVASDFQMTLSATAAVTAGNDTTAANIDGIEFKMTAAGAYGDYTGGNVLSLAKLQNMSAGDVATLADNLTKYAALQGGNEAAAIGAMRDIILAVKKGTTTPITSAMIQVALGNNGAIATTTGTIGTAFKGVAKAGTLAVYTLNNNVYVSATTNTFDARQASDGKIVTATQVGTGVIIDKPLNNTVIGDGTEIVGFGPYTGNIDKNWSINLLEDTKSAGKVTDVVDKAEFYRADQSDYAKYNGKNGVKINPNAWYVKVTLKDKFSSVSDAAMKYYVYIANNNGNTSEKTDKVWVAGKYKNDEGKYVDFNWSNNATSPAVWTVRDSESGTAVFDFADKAFLTVKMYSGEKMYLDMSSAFQKGVNAIEGLADAEFDSFIKFDTANANFSRSAELVIASDVKDMFVYQITKDNEFIPMDAEYVTGYKIAHTNSKVNGYKFNTKDLGNFVLSKDEIVTEEEAPAEEAPTDEVPTTTPETPVEKPAETAKPNPNTGANDFVGVAVALAVVSVAAAGALALKK